MSSSSLRLRYDLHCVSLDGGPAVDRDRTASSGLATADAAPRRPAVGMPHPARSGTGAPDHQTRENRTSLPMHTRRTRYYIRQEFLSCIYIPASMMCIPARQRPAGPMQTRNCAAATSAVRMSGSCTLAPMTLDESQVLPARLPKGAGAARAGVVPDVNARRGRRVALG